MKLGKNIGSITEGNELPTKQRTRNKDEKGEKEMTAEIQKKSKIENDNEKAKSSLEAEIKRVYQERDELWSRNWCPFCGRTDCKSKLHFLKLYTLPMSSLPPGKAFLMRVVPFGILLLLIIGGKILYLMFKNN